MLAWLFHWPPESLWKLTAQDLMFWAARAKDVQNSLQNGKNHV
ncbi:GpE family phage tail protein [uncultured Desulfovibrio sp.]|nr:GpE family phage tail protein [uncultured Desulfovibrio sp.]